MASETKRTRTKRRKTKRVFKTVKILFIIIFALCICHIHSNNIFNSILNSNPVYLTEAPSSYEDPYKDVPLHHYNWDNLSNQFNRFEYIDSEGNGAMQGVDISRYQGDINWTKVKKSGISFAMLRVGYRGYESGLINLDEKFIQNIQQATAEDIEVGAYFFSQAITEEEALEEANFVIQNIAKYEITFPIVFDLEEVSSTDHRTHTLTKEQRTKIAMAFCKHIEGAGYKAMIYGNASWLTDYYDLTQIIQYDIWLAQYSETPSFPYEFKMWQYTSSGTVDGIDAMVDINLCFTPYN